MITGASAGIGEATARRLARSGHSLVLLARRTERLNELSKQCRALGAPKVLSFALDVRDKKACEDFFASSELKTHLASLSILVNNAGLAAGVDLFDRANLEDIGDMVDTNVVGVLTMTRLSLEMIKKNRGHIINMGSVAAHWAYAGGTVYCATKAAIASLTEGLRLDLAGSGVRVTNIEPGMVETEFSLVRLKNAEAAQNVYKGMTPLKADDIAETIEWCLSRPPHVNIQELLIFPTDQSGVGAVHRR